MYLLLWLFTLKVSWINTKQTLIIILTIEFEMLNNVNLFFEFWILKPSTRIEHLNNSLFWSIIMLEYYLSGTQVTACTQLSNCLELDWTRSKSRLFRIVLTLKTLRKTCDNQNLFVLFFFFEKYWYFIALLLLMQSLVVWIRIVIYTGLES